MNEFKNRYASLLEDFLAASEEASESGFWLGWEWRRGGPEMTPLSVFGHFLCYLQLPHSCDSDSITDWFEAAVTLSHPSTERQRREFRRLAGEAGARLPASFKDQLGRYVTLTDVPAFGSDINVARWCALLFLARGTVSRTPIHENQIECFRSIDRPFLASAEVIQQCALCSDTPTYPQLTLDSVIPTYPQLASDSVPEISRCQEDRFLQLLVSARNFARAHLKGKQRRTLLSVIERELELLDSPTNVEPLSLTDLQVIVDWEDPKDGFTGTQREVNKKLKAAGIELALRRKDNCARLMLVESDQDP